MTAAPAPLTALLVDDEPLALRRLNLAIAAIGGVDVVGSTTSARQAVRMIAELAPDVVFLDIAMPGIDGFEIAEQLGADDAPAIVFVTAYDQHAVRAFDADAVDYLLKPVAPERLRAAIGRVRNWIAGRSAPEDMDREEGRLGPDDSLWVHRHQEFVRVRVDDIAWIEAEGDYVRLHAGDGGGLVRATLSSLEARLDPQVFVRVHRSAICRLSAISGLHRKPTGALAVRLANGDEAPVGRSYNSGLRALLRRMQAASA
jgi:two-component system response regulator AlgR